MFSDTERLAWLLENYPEKGIDVDSKDKNSSYWVKVLSINGESIVYKGKDFFNCIDKALKVDNGEKLANKYSRTYKLFIGDHSCSGHSYYADIAIKTNVSISEIATAYHKACEKSGVNFHKNGICTEAYDSQLSENEITKLNEYGIDPLEFMEEMYDEEYGFEEVDDFALLILSFIKKELDFEYEIIDVPKSIMDKLEKINGLGGVLGSNFRFGYGLYGDGSGPLSNEIYNHFMN